MAWRRGQAYGQDLRHGGLANPVMTLVQGATRFGVSPPHVSKIRARLRDLGEAAPGPQHNHVPLRPTPFADSLRAQIKASPDATLNELRSWLSETKGVSVSCSVMWKVVVRLGLTLDADRLVFLDETGATTNMARTRGRAANGERLACSVPHGHWHTITVLAGLRTTGLVAPLLLDGAINGAAFLACTEQFLVPTIEDRWQTIGRLLERFRPDECAKYIRHCGCAQSVR